MSQEDDQINTQFRKRILFLGIFLVIEFGIGYLVEYLGRRDIRTAIIDYRYLDPSMKLGTAIMYVFVFISMNKIKNRERNMQWNQFSLMFLLKLIIMGGGIVTHVLAFWVFSGSFFVTAWIISEVLYVIAYILEAIAWYFYGKYIENTEYIESDSAAIHTIQKQILIRTANTISLACLFAIPYYVIDMIWIIQESILVFALQMGFFFALGGIISYLRGVIRINSILNPQKQSPSLYGINPDNPYNDKASTLGTYNANVAKFCPKCGSSLVPGEEFCVKCGWEKIGVSNVESPKCPKCGETLGLGGDFCTRCGWTQS